MRAASLLLTVGLAAGGCAGVTWRAWSAPIGLLADPRTCAGTIAARYAEDPRSWLPPHDLEDDKAALWDECIAVPLPDGSLHVEARNDREGTRECRRVVPGDRFETTECTPSLSVSLHHVVVPLSGAWFQATADAEGVGTIGLFRWDGRRFLLVWERGFGNQPQLIEVGMGPHGPVVRSPCAEIETVGCAFEEKPRRPLRRFEVHPDGTMEQL